MEVVYGVNTGRFAFAAYHAIAAAPALSVDGWSMRLPRSQSESLDCIVLPRLQLFPPTPPVLATFAIDTPNRAMSARTRAASSALFGGSCRGPAAAAVSDSDRRRRGPSSAARALRPGTPLVLHLAHPL